MVVAPTEACPGLTRLPPHELDRVRPQVALGIKRELQRLLRRAPIDGAMVYRLSVYSTPESRTRSGQTRRPTLPYRRRPRWPRAIRDAHSVPVIYQPARDEQARRGKRPRPTAPVLIVALRLRLLPLTRGRRAQKRSYAPVEELDREEVQLLACAHRQSQICQSSWTSPSSSGT